MRFTKILIVCLFFFSSVSAKNYFNEMHVRNGKDFSFRIFSGGSGPGAATRINRFLQLSELYSLASPPYSGRIFNQAQANDGSIYGGKVSMTSRVFSNNRSILSVGFYETSSGATTHYWNKYYNFNPANGDRIDLGDLFTEAGYVEFKANVAAIRLSKLRSEVRKKIHDAEPRKYFLGEVAGCIEDDDLRAFYIVNGEIFIDGDDCLIKNAKFDGLDMVVKIARRHFVQHLNQYGKAVFGLSSAKLFQFRSTKLPQLYEGAVDGKYRFVLVLSPTWPDEYWGMYAYLKYGEGIALRGSDIDGLLALDEYILSRTVTDGPLGLIRTTEKKGSIKGHIAENSFEGEWIDELNERRLSFVAKGYR